MGCCSVNSILSFKLRDVLELTPALEKVFWAISESQTEYNQLEMCCWQFLLLTWRLAIRDRFPNTLSSRFLAVNEIIRNDLSSTNPHS